MDDITSKLIVTLVAENERAEIAWKYPHNKNRANIGKGIELSSRDSTPAEEEEDNSELQLTFSIPPKVPQNGFRFGSLPRDCDILLEEKRQGIGRRHCCITFDALDRVIVKATTTAETHVSYEGQGDYPRTHFTWIMFDDIQSIIVTVGKRTSELQFQVVLPERNSDAIKSYKQKRKQYLKDCRNAPILLDRLGIESEETTARPSQSQSPKGRPIYILGTKIGQGGFGAVYMARDVSTGDIYAGKEFYGSGWEREVEIMKRVSHVSIAIYQGLNMSNWSIRSILSNLWILPTKASHYW